MAVMFHDIRPDDEAPSSHRRMEGLTAVQVLYADDTISYTTDADAMSRLVAAIEEEGQKFGLKLNRNKYELLSLDSIIPVHFKDKTKLKRKAESRYLGCQLNDKGDTKEKSKAQWPSAWQHGED